MGKKAKGPVARGLETACKKIIKQAVGKNPDGNAKKVSEWATKKVCKDVDQTLLKAAAEQLRDIAKKQNPKAPPGTPKKIKTIPKLKPPGGGSPSLTLELKKIKLGEGKEGKVELKLWADPGDPNADKGIFFNVTVTF